jgi:hypothetical protein
MMIATAAMATAAVGKLRAGTGSVNRGEEDGWASGSRGCMIADFILPGRLC